MSVTMIQHAVTEHGLTMVLHTRPALPPAGAARPTGPVGKTGSVLVLPTLPSIGPFKDVSVLLFVPSTEVPPLVLSAELGVCGAPMSGAMLLPPTPSMAAGCVHMDGTLVLLVAPSMSLAIDCVSAGGAPVLLFAPSSKLIVGRVPMLPFTLSFMLTSGHALIWGTPLLLALQSKLVGGTLVLFAPS